MGEEKASTANVAKSAATAGSDDGGLDFDLSFGEDDSSTTAEEEPLSMDMDTTMEFEASDTSDGLDFGGLEMESEESEVAVAEADDSPIELSLDMEEETTSASDDSMSLDFDQGADIVQFDSGNDEIDLDGELDEDIFSNVDEVGTKLDLAKAYVDMGDSDGARSILDEVLEEGDDSQKQQAEELLAQMG
jgi:pilus assembly protein FimV